MADAEVMATPGDMVRVKQEKGESSDNHKTQIILHLQPILQGVNEDIAETGTTVLAIETHHEEEGAEGEEVEYGYPITCGDNRAVLLFKKFVCPGINVRCVKFNDQLISPKQFVHLAGKATLKDWKRAIRLGGVMLRKMMDSGQIDFYQHDTVCTNTCRSTKFDQLANNTRLSSGTVLQAASSPLSGWGLEIEEGPEEKPSGITDWSPGPASPINPTTANGHFKRRRVEIADGTLDFWRGVADIGLMGDVLSSIRTELLATLKRVEVRSDKANLLEADGQVLNSLCEMFGLLDSVRRALDLRHSHTEDNQQLDHKPINENSVEDQRRQNQHSPGLPNAGSSSKPTSSKRLRLHQTTPSTAQTQNQTILSPFTSSQMGQSVSLAGLPVATLAQLPTDSEDVTHHATSSGGKHCRAWALHAAPGRTLFSPTKESGLGMPAHSVSQEKEQQRVMNKDRPRIQTDSIQGTVVARRKDSHLRKEDEGIGKDGEEADVEREG